MEFLYGIIVQYAIGITIGFIIAMVSRKNTKGKINYKIIVKKFFAISAMFSTFNSILNNQPCFISNLRF